jgi:hypothetical protein
MILARPRPPSAVARAALTIFAALAFAAPLASAGELGKEECLDAHSRGQDAKEQNKLSLARKLFLTCAQSSCPALVQGDCARFADDLSRLQPTVTFVARDSAGTDLPDTSVYVDGALVLTHLDGAPHDIDPGSHAVKFQSGGKEHVLTVVVGTGEKGRTIVATFKAASSAAPDGATAGARVDNAVAVTAVTPTPHTAHPAGAKALIWGGVALTVGGAALGTVGVLKLPSNCSLSTHRCAAAPGDPSLAAASSDMRLTDIGWAVGAAGLAAIVGGTYWYLSHGKSVTEHLAVTPWLPPSGGGLAVGGPL